jgi:hypothetical protein
MGLEVALEDQKPAWLEETAHLIPEPVVAFKRPTCAVARKDSVNTPSLQRQLSVTGSVVDE